MLQTLPICFRKKETKQLRKKKKKYVSPARSRTRVLRFVRTTHYPLRHATIAETARQINCI